MGNETTEAAERGAEFVEHFGVKGMRWGQRKTETVTTPNFRKQTLETKKVTPKKAAKMDKKWEAEVGSANTWVSVHNDAANHVNSKIDGINSKFEREHPKEYNNGTLLKDDHPLTQQYHKEYIAAFKEGLNKSVSELSSSPTGKKRVKLVTANEHSLAEFTWQVGTEKVKHAADDPEEVIVFVVQRDAQGRITNVQPKKNTMAQSVEFVDEFLSHYGVLGMRWGVRNRRGEPVAVTPMGRSRVPHGKVRKTKVKVEGGEHHPATEDAIKAAEVKAKLKKSGMAALSNRELREIAERIRLEEQAKDLVQPKGRKWIKGLLKDQGTQTSRTLIRETTENVTGIGGGGGKKR